jgi:hypothetical protein
METKTCRTCKTAKPLADFYATEYGAQGRRATCKECTRTKAAPRRVDEIRRANLARYGMTIEQYDEMFEGQGGLCAICGEPETAISRNGKPFLLAVDHHHPSERIRGLLCGRCNRIVGHIEAGLDLLDRIHAYLEKYSE